MKTVYVDEPSPFNKPEEVKIMPFSKGELFIVRWQYQQAGGFERALAEAMSKADTKNLNAFALGFPEETEAMWKYKTEPGWWQKVSTRYTKWMGWHCDDSK